MPRGPGKKANYNLDYSRFNQFENEHEGAEVLQKHGRDATNTDHVPPLEDIVPGMPQELQEAFMLMKISRETGNKAAEQKANELVMQAVKKGGPQMQREFFKLVSEQMPGAANRLAPEFQKEEDKGVQLSNMGGKIDQLRQQLESGKEAARKQLEDLQKQQEQLESMKSPEDVANFLRQEGINDEDMQRFFSGDQSHLEKKLHEMMDKAAPGINGKLENSDRIVEAAEELASIISDDHSTPAKFMPGKPMLQLPECEAKPMQDAKIPDYRLQYQKDSEERYTAVELRCTLPGVINMSMVLLDVSESYIRLNTSLPAPSYAVNTGPFPVLIEPSGACAKWNKRKEELFVVVPVKMHQ